MNKFFSNQVLRRIGFLIVLVAFLSSAVAGIPVPSPRDDDGDDDDQEVARVLLISIDGLHAIDLARYVTNNPNSTLAQLSHHGRTYTNAASTKPSDSFPGLLAMVTGGTPRSTGVYYDDGYDRLLAPASGICAPGTRAQWKQNLDVLPLSYTTVLDPNLFPRDPASGCTRVFPHQFPRVNNIFELVKANGGRTAWSDKHPAYEFLNGPSGTGIDDLYTPEIQTSVGGVVTTNSFALTMAYDDMKVAAVLNWIHGLDHTGTTAAPVPTLFGMNFQAVSVGQKLAQAGGGPVGGYLDAAATPSAALQQTLDHTDASIGQMVAALQSQGLLSSTMIIISAKHGNSPIDPSLLVRVNPTTITNIVNAAAPGALALLSADTGPLIWLKDQSKTAAVVAALEADRVGANTTHTSHIISGAELTNMFVDPLTDNRAPDIILEPILGTVYTTSLTKIADHGGFDADDTHVALLVSRSSLPRKAVTDSVETRQIACTILKALDIDCKKLDSEHIEPSRALPNSNHGHH